MTSLNRNGWDVGKSFNLEVDINVFKFINGSSSYSDLTTWAVGKVEKNADRVNKYSNPETLVNINYFKFLKELNQIP